MAARPYSRLTKAQKIRLRRSLVERLSEAGIDANVQLEDSPLAGHYRLYVIADAFDRLLEIERQDILWRALKDVWSRDDQLRLTLSLALSPEEAQETTRPKRKRATA